MEFTADLKELITLYRKLYDEHLMAYEGVDTGIAERHRKSQKYYWFNELVKLNENFEKGVIQLVEENY